MVNTIMINYDYDDDDDDYYYYYSTRSAERSQSIISWRAKRPRSAFAVCGPGVDPSELQTRSSHLYLYISDGVRHDVIQ